MLPLLFALALGADPQVRCDASGAWLSAPWGHVHVAPDGALAGAGAAPEPKAQPAGARLWLAGKKLHRGSTLWTLPGDVLGARELANGAVLAHGAALWLAQPDGTVRALDTGVAGKILRLAGVEPFVWAVGEGGAVLLGEDATVAVLPWPGGRRSRNSVSAYAPDGRLWAIVLDTLMRCDPEAPACAAIGPAGASGALHLGVDPRSIGARAEPGTGAKDPSAIAGGPAAGSTGATPVTGAVVGSSGATPATGAVVGSSDAATPATGAVSGSSGTATPATGAVAGSAPANGVVAASGSTEGAAAGGVAVEADPSSVATSAAAVPGATDAGAQPAAEAPAPIRATLTLSTRAGVYRVDVDGQNLAPPVLLEKARADLVLCDGLRVDRDGVRAPGSRATRPALLAAAARAGVSLAPLELLAGALADAGARVELMALAQAAPPEVRVEALYRLRPLALAESAELVATSLLDEDLEVRHAALELLRGSCRPPIALSPGPGLCAPARSNQSLPPQHTAVLPCVPDYDAVHDRCLELVLPVLEDVDAGVAYHAREVVLVVDPIAAIASASRAFLLNAPGLLRDQLESGDPRAEQALQLLLAAGEADVQAAAAAALDRGGE